MKIALEVKRNVAREDINDTVPVSEEAKMRFLNMFKEAFDNTIQLKILLKSEDDLHQPFALGTKTKSFKMNTVIKDVQSISGDIVEVEFQTEFDIVFLLEDLQDDGGYGHRYYMSMWHDVPISGVALHSAQFSEGRMISSKLCKTIDRI
jgi:hypothetical protein